MGKKIFKSFIWTVFLFGLLSTNLNAQIIGVNEIVAGSSSSFSTPVVNGASYFWSTTGGITITSPTNTNNAVQVKKVGSSLGTLYLVVYNGLGSVGSCYQISITIPAPCFVSPGVINDLLCVTNNHPFWRLEMNLAPINQNVTYQWFGANFNILSGNNLQYVIGNPTDNGTGFILYCTVTKTCSRGIKTSKIFYYQSNSLNQCGQGITGVTTGIFEDEWNDRQSDFEKFSAYPNPFSEKVNFNYFIDRESDKVTIHIYNFLGKLVYSPMNNQFAILGFNEVSVESSKLKEKGLYFVCFYVNDELKKTLKINLN